MQNAIADDEVSPAWFYRPLQRAGLVWVSDARGRLEGFAACEAFTDGLHLLELAVCHEAQGRGVGRALVLAVAEAARRRGLGAVTLTTFRSIVWNGPFYTKLGFAELSGAELDSRLAAVLKREARRGLTDRCAMRLTILRRGDDFDTSGNALKA